MTRLPNEAALKMDGAERAADARLLGRDGYF